MRRVFQSAIAVFIVACSDGGNPSTPLPTSTIVGAPTLASIGDDTGRSNSDRITSDRTITFSGSGEPGTRVSISLNGTVVGTALASGGGSWTLDNSTVPLADGSYSIRLWATRATAASATVDAGTLVIDNVAPAAPILAAAKGKTVNYNTGDTVNGDDISFTGKAENNAIIIASLNNITLGSINANQIGDWQFSLDFKAMGLGMNSIRFLAEDVAGNRGGQSADFQLVRGAQIIDLAAIDASSGVTFVGADVSKWMLRGSGIGDFNGDGIDDIAISAPAADSASIAEVGKLYVVFGSRNFPASFDIDGLDGANGFVIEGPLQICTPYPGCKLTGGFDEHKGFDSGDLNGDGLSDIVVGNVADGFAGLTAEAQDSVWVIYGTRSRLPAMVNVTALTNPLGFRIKGNTVCCLFGSSMALAGDVDGDGYADLLVSNPRNNSGLTSFTGNVYLLYGRSQAYPSVVSLLNGGSTVFDIGRGWRIGGPGLTQYEWFGRTLAAGDINNDGKDDLVISVGFDDGFYVIFGKGSGPSMGLAPEMLGVSDGFKVTASDPSIGNIGLNVSVIGDLNRDGYAELATNEGDEDGDSNYFVLFGGPNYGGTTVDLTAASPRTIRVKWSASAEIALTGFASHDRLNGLDSGDFNGDNFDDLLVAAYLGNGRGGAPEAGQVWLFLNPGAAGFPNLLDQSRVFGNGAAIFFGKSAGDRLGYGGARNAGDFNGDGIDDLLIGTSRVDASSPKIRQRTGELYLVYGDRSW